MMAWQESRRNRQVKNWVVSTPIGTEEGMMVKQLAVLLSAILILGLGLNYGAWAQSKVESVKTETVVNFSGKIVAVDTTKKLVTLEGSEGRKVTVQVLNPDNLKAAKVGEPYAVRYYEVVNIRRKKPGENVQRASSVGVWTTNPLGVPGGSRAQQATVLVTVDKIDEADGTVTVKAADGTTQTVKARDPQNLKQLNVGDQLVISTYQAIAISLQKQSGG
jgi:hypothetical protein